jgi:hypothetical protein
LNESDTEEPQPAPETRPDSPSTGATMTPRWRRVVSIVLLVVGFILIPISAVAIWSRNQLLNTDRYVETVEPLADNADIQAAVSTAAVNALFDHVDAEQRIEDALPKRAKFLGEPLAGAMKGYATTITAKLLASSQFEKLWDTANRRAHTQLVALLTDDSGKNKGAVAIKNGAVTLNITSVIKEVQAKLVEKGLSFLQNVSVPPVAATVKIIDSKGLAEARGYVSLLNTLAWVLPVLAFGSLIVSALIVKARRRAAIRSGIVLVAGCAFTLVLLAVGRSLYLGEVKAANKNAATAVFDILVRNLRYGLLTLAVVGIIVAIAAYFIGPSKAAVKARSYASSGISGARTRADGAGFDAGPVAEFAARYRKGIEIVVVGVFVLIFLAWDRPGIGTVIGLTLVCLLVIAFVEFLARQPELESGSESELVSVPEGESH